MLDLLLLLWSRSDAVSSLVCRPCRTLTSDFLLPTSGIFLFPVAKEQPNISAYLKPYLFWQNFLNIFLNTLIFSIYFLVKIFN